MIRPVCGGAGGVARFFNHSCDGGNLVVQSVLAEGDSALCFRLGFFALKGIPAGTEMTYDYHWPAAPDGLLKCECGTKDCRGRLLPPPVPGAGA